MLTRSYDEMVRARIQRDPKFRRALIREALCCLFHLELSLAYKVL